MSMMFLREELKNISREVVKQEYPERLLASGAAIDISDEIPVGTVVHSYKIFTMVGEAAVLANGGKDIPMVDAFVEEKFAKVYEIADGFEYKIRDLEAAQKAGTSLTSTLAMGAREIMEAKLDQVAYVGEPGCQLLGILNQPNVSIFAVAADGNSNGGTNSTKWIHKTSAQIYRDLSAFAAYMRKTTKSVYSPEIIGLPQSQFDLILDMPYSATSDKTVLQFFLDAQKLNPQGVQRVVPMVELEGRAVGGGDMAVAYRKRPQNQCLHIVQDFDMLEPQLRGFSYEVLCRMQTAGVEMRRPQAFLYLYGI